jgi:hypothetical protein
MISNDVKTAFKLGKKEGIEETKKWIEGLIEKELDDLHNNGGNNPNNIWFKTYGRMLDLNKQISGAEK